MSMWVTPEENRRVNESGRETTEEKEDFIKKP